MPQSQTSFGHEAPGSLASEDTFIPESEVPSLFDELDPMEESDFKLRTLVDFEVMDDKGNRVSFHDLQKCKENGIALTVRGYVIEPLDLNFRQAITSSASSAESSTVAAPEESLGQGLVDIEESTAETKLDRGALAVGTSVDGYCNKTFQWFASKIVAVRGDKEVKVHFQGWNAKHDEWMDRQSERIAPYGSSAKTVFDSIRRAENMVPWYEMRRLYSKAARRVGEKNINTHPYPQSKLNYKLKRQAVVISGVSDWCIDLSYCTPSLWLIADSDVWYRVAGLFVPGGVLGFPAAGYASVFDPFVGQFESCAHVAMVLLDFYGQNPKLTMQDVCAEVVARTNGCVGESRILDAWSLTSNQISSLERSEDWDPKMCKPFKESLFMQQLIKYGRAATFARDKAAKAALNPNSRGKRDHKAASSDPSLSTGELPKSVENEWSLMQVGRREDQKQSLYNVLIKPKRKDARVGRSPFPVPDADLWDIEFFKGNYPKMHPKPVKSHRPKCPGQLFTYVLQTWSLLMQYRATDGLGNFPYINLDRFINLLGLDTLTESLPSNQLPMLDPLLRNLIIRLLAHGFSKGQWDSMFCNTRMSIFEALPIVFGATFYFGKHDMLTGGICTSVDNYLATICAQGGMVKSGGSNIGQSAVRASKLSAEGKQSFFKDSIRTIGQGDAWVEVLRMAIAQQEGFTLPEYVDGIAETLYALLDVANDPQADAFLEPVNPQQDNVPNYESVVTNPICLEEIIARIEQGWYDHYVCTGTNPKSASLPGNETRFSGSSGILYDVQRVWDNCRLFWKTIPLPEGEEVHPLVKDANELEHKFQVALVNRSSKGSDSATAKPAGEQPTASEDNPGRSIKTELGAESELPDSSASAGKFHGVSSVLKDGKYLQYSNKEPWEEVAAGLGKAVEPAFIPRVVLLHALRWLLLEFSRSFEVEQTRVQPSAVGEADSTQPQKDIAVLFESGKKGPAPRNREKENEARREARAKAAAAKKGASVNGEEVDEKEAADVAAAIAASLADAKAAEAAKAEKPDDMDVEGEEETQTATKSKASIAKDKAAAPVLVEPKHNACVCVDAEGNMLKYQNVALGYDRHGYRYWTFSFAGWPLNSKAPQSDASMQAAGGTLSPPPELGRDSFSIYCEDMVTGRWYIYSDVADLQALLAWLNVNGRNEAALSTALERWMVDCSIPCREGDAAVAAGGAASKSIDEDGGEPSGKRARLTPPTSVEASTVPLSEQYKQNWHPFELTSILYNCRVQYVDSLGMGVKETKEKTKGRNVVVVNHTVANGTKSAAAEAGICIGDRLITCNGIVLNSIKSIVSAIKDAKDAVPEGQTVILDIVVARSSNQLGRIEEKLCDDNVRNAALSYNMDACNLQQKTNCPARTAGQLVDLLHRFFSEKCTAEGAEFLKKHIPALTCLVAPPTSRPPGHHWRYDAGIWEQGAPPLLQMRDTLLMLETFMAATTNFASKTVDPKAVDRCLLPLWLGDDRLRYRWRKMVASVHSYSTISVCATVLSLAMNRLQLP